MPHPNLPENWLSVWDRLTEDQKTKVNEIVNKGLDYINYLHPETIDNNTFEDNYINVRDARGIWELDDYTPPTRVEETDDLPQLTREEEEEMDAAIAREEAREAARDQAESLEHAEIDRPSPEVAAAREEEERRFEAYEHMILPQDWIEISKKELNDPVTNELYRDPYVASDGMTYSRDILERMFRVNLSPRGIIGLPLTKINDQVGIPNIKVSMLINKFKEGKLKISEN